MNHWTWQRSVIRPAVGAIINRDRYRHHRCVAVVERCLDRGTLQGYQVPLTDFDLLEIVKGILVFGITWLVIKNLPGVLELSVLRASSIEAGTKYAITSLCRYAIGAIGLWLITSVLNVDFTQFGWMAAALSVGLGFGLQEVITNFVCGLILLFERPVRIGDVVTIQGTTGTVTKIRMRATTITNWDRQSLSYPIRV